MLEPKQGEEGVHAGAEVGEEVIPALDVAPGGFTGGVHVLAGESEPSRVRRTYTMRWDRDGIGDFLHTGEVIK